MLVIVGGLFSLPPGLASAQPRAAVVDAVVTGDGAALATSLQRVVRAQVDALDVAELEATPALGLADLGLAVGCVGGSADCLDQIAAQLDVEVLIWLELERSSDVVTLALHAHTRGESPRQVSRDYRGADADRLALDDVEGVVRQLFGLPPPEPEPEPVREPAPVRAETSAGLDDGVAIGVPVALLSAGALTLAAGLVLGAVSQGSSDEYAELELTGAGDVDTALALHDRASNEATAANVLYVAGGALLAGGVVALIVTALLDGDDEEPAELALGPLLGDSTLGLTVAGRFGGAR